MEDTLGENFIGLLPCCQHYPVALDKLSLEYTLYPALVSHYCLTIFSTLELRAFREGGVLHLAKLC